MMEIAVGVIAGVLNFVSSGTEDVFVIIVYYNVLNIIIKYNYNIKKTKKK